jgi:hypothetical protein
VRKSLDGYHTAEETVTLATDKTIPLAPLSREYTRAVEVNLTSGELLGANFVLRGYGIPDWLFLWVNEALWVQPPATVVARVVYHQDLGVGIGGYLFFPPESPVRLGASTGAGLVISVPSAWNTPLYSDFYIDFLNWWVETSVLGPTLFLRQEYKYALGLGTNLLGQGWLVNGIPEMTLGVLFRW